MAMLQLHAFVLKCSNLCPTSEYSCMLLLCLLPNLHVVNILSFRFSFKLSLESLTLSTPTCSHSLFLSSVLSAIQNSLVYLVTYLCVVCFRTRMKVRERGHLPYLVHYNVQSYVSLKVCSKHGKM